MRLHYFRTLHTMSTILQVKKLVPEAQIPKRGSVDAAGFDLYASKGTVIPKGGKGIVKTGISLACPPGTYGRVAPRSGLAVKKFIDVGAGVIDADYRGEVGVVLFNFGDEDFTVNVGDRVAQLVLEKICMADAVEVEELTETERGAGGFGSTGVSAQQTISVGTKRPISPIELLDDSPMDDLFIYLDSISNDLPTDVREKVKKSILAGSAEVKMLLRVCSKTGNVKSLIESMNILQ